ncbi:MAG: hypothetical protein KGD74_06270 [Candidatus Lokiarchaeota archaeon]|nr:hypothetical protein [Candidatus Lokiarchaeota archaeon]
MKKFSDNSLLKKGSILRITSLIILLAVFLSSSFLIPNSNNITEIDREFNEFSQLPLLANTDPIIFEGNENALNITDCGNLYKDDQQVEVTNQEAVNLTYYLDDVHDWEVSKVSTEITNIQDTIEWVNNSDFLPVTIYKVYETHESAHDYLQNRNKGNTLDTISQSGAIAMRVHFTQLSYENGWDYFYIEDENDFIQFTHTGLNYLDFYSPWIRGGELNCYYESDNLYNYYGYQIDYYEFVNSSSNYDINSYSWGFNNISLTQTNYGAGQAGNVSAMFTSLNADLYTLDPPDPPDPYDVTYFEDDFSEIYQNITIPRGQIIDGYISFNYYAEFAMDSNENFIYLEINNKKVYSKGLRDINDAGKNTWLSTGLINMALWVNTSNIFDNILIDNVFNISVGIMSGATITYSGFEDQYQQVFWFDNVSLVLTTLANSSQSDINLRLNNYALNQGTGWADSFLNLTGIWDSNPLILTVTTNSPSLSFDLDTSLYGYHETKSRVGQTTLEGLSYEILENGTIIWEFSHNLYIPAQYSDFEFTIHKPENWNFISVLDPTLQSRPYENGGEGDSILHISKENALFPGWWAFKATSPNYLNLTNTKLSNQGPFTTGESTRISTQVNNSNEILSNLESTQVNLTIFDPEGNQWYSEVSSPLVNGTVFFSELTFSALNTTGGQFDYTLFWSNGTALGGIKSNFIVNHQSQIKLLKPNDAKSDLIADGFVGDIIPVRIILTDPENNLSISDAIISYNWTGGSTLNFTEAAIGVYETILDTADLSSRGLYEILISSSKLGFLESNLTLKINLGEETNLQRLESEYNIELHANSSIKFKFTDFSGDGIDGADVNISISNSSLYSITNSGNGIYDIEFSTSYIEQIGYYQLNFTFSAIGYEPQYYNYEFQIIEQSVSISVFLSSLNIIEDSLLEFTYFDFINISTKVKSNIDDAYILGGNITWVSELYESNFSAFADYWYNFSMQCLPEYFSSVINNVVLKFQHPNYRTETFGFELQLNRIEFDVDIVGHEDANPTVKTDIGSNLNLQIELLDFETNQSIVNATVLYEWAYGVGELIEVTPGIYQLSTKLPENVQGNFIFNLIISKEGNVYKTTQSSFLLVIGEPEFPVLLIWIIILISAAIISVLGVLSLRSYVILPRKRKKEADLLSRTQKFKDIQNIQAIVAIHRYSGIPLYSKSYSILEKSKKELFSGFIQAIITVGEEMVGKREIDRELTKFENSDGSRTILELDFKYFYCLICDRDDLRVIFILNEKGSDQLKKLISDLSLGIMFDLSELIENWDGAIHEIESKLPPVIAKYVDLYYKEAFKINDTEYIAKVRKESELNSMETRILNVIYSIAKSKSEFYLKTIFEVVHEKNQDLIIDAIETLINKQVIIPSIK